MRGWLSGLLVAVICLVSLPVQACTLWSANGNLVAGGGTMLVKNRDWIPNQHEIIKLAVPKTGYRYLGLYAEGKYPGFKAGINEQGLVIVSATAGSIPAVERRAMPHTSGLLVRLLNECSTVDEALARTDLFLGPEILMLADQHKVAAVEIGPEGKYQIEVKQNGAIYHTNHYVYEDMVNLNRTIGESSQARYDRIGQLLSIAAKPYAFADFLSFSTDQNAGPDNSIFRVGSTPTKTRTMAVWAVKLPPEGSPEVYVRILNPDEAERVFQFKAADVFNGNTGID
ncbi:MAG: C45 family autoproteolytic acyltransferase/hydrolase [Sporomusaceae bacterium]|nr:C45 family autoproteolytic acyltransferase/hydrolase [Sporomusaceae bacterium]